jgi:hypothetical protein
MAKKEKEDSVVFSLRELKNIASEPKKAEKPAELAASAEPRRSRKAHEPDEKESDAQVTQALSSLRERVTEERHRVEEAKRRAEEERRLKEELRALEEEHKKAEAARAHAERDRQHQAEQVTKLQRDVARRSGQTGEFALEDDAAPRPRRIELKPSTLVVGLVVVVGALIAMAAYAFLRAPEVRVVTKADPRAVARGGAAAIPPGALDFGTEISWLDVGDVAGPAVAADDDEKSPPKRKKKGRRRRASAAASEEAKSDAPKKPKFVPPTKGSGFIY